MIKVSIIMPSLNVGPYIEECLASVVYQTLSEIEIICIDAGSTDGTREIIQNYADRDSRIRLISSDIKSYGYQMNLGIRMAKGEYVGIVETDDYIASGMYEHLYRLAKENVLDVIWAEYDRFCENASGQREFYNILSWGQRPEMYNRLFNARQIGSVSYMAFAIWRGIYNRQFLLAHNLFFNETPGAAFQDIGFCNRLLMHVEKLMCVPESFYRYRTDWGQSSSNVVKGICYAKNEYKVMLDNNEILPEFEAGFYRRMAASVSWELSKVKKFAYPIKKIDKKWLHQNEPDYQWFRNILLQAEKTSLPAQDPENERAITIIHSLPPSLFDFAVPILNPKNYDFEKSIKDKRLILCGTDLHALHKLEQYLYVKIEAICSDSQTPYAVVGELPVLPMREAAIHMPDATFLIADTRNSQELQAKLAALGIGEENICVCPEEIIHPTLTFILPVEGESEALKEGLLNILAQYITDFEVLLIRQGSSQDNLKHLHQLSGLDQRIKVLYVDAASYGSLLDLGLEMAKGEFVVLLESGALLPRDSFYRHYNWVKSKKLDIIFPRDMDISNWDRINQPAEIRNQPLPEIERGRIFERLIGPGGFYPNRFLTALRDNLCNYSSGRIIIVGAGARGKRLFTRLNLAHVLPDAFADNNESLWNTQVNGLPVLSPAECVNKYPEHIYLITVKGHPEEIRQQLLSLGLKKNQIFVLYNC